MKIHLGRVEAAFAVLLGLYVVFTIFGWPGAIFVKLALFFLGVWVSIRFARSAVKQMLWRLRNRLVVAYFFIALVPIVLITALVGLGTDLVGGQISIYLVTSELERRTTVLRSSMEFLARGPLERADRAENFGAFLRSRHPGLEVIVEEAGKVSSWPDGEATVPPPRKWPATSGLVLRNRRLYGWARVLRGDRVVTATFPVTRDLVGQMAPGIGESNILLFSENATVLHEADSDPDTPVHNRLPPRANMLDFEIWWATPLHVAVWEKPDATHRDTWFSIRTRPSAVLRTVFAQKIDFANETIPILFFGVAILFLIAEGIALIIGVSLTRTITAAVHDLYVGTQHVARGDFSHRIQIYGKDQLAELAQSFNQMAGNMQRLLAVEKERASLQAELEIAREVQNQLYPRSEPDIRSVRLTAVCDPARMVSGDYYDYQQLGPDRIAVAIGDVAGKGISAALLMATVQSSFRTQLRGSLGLAAAANEGGSRVTVSTSGVVSHLNRQLFADTAPEKYATFLLGIYDDKSSTFTYTNAGHLPPILVRRGEAVRLEVNGMVVGAFAAAKYDESSVNLEKDDLLVFFTDGVSEPENEYGEMFGEERLIDILVRNSHMTEKELAASVSEAVHVWTGSTELQDDLTLLLLRKC